MKQAPGPLATRAGRFLRHPAAAAFAILAVALATRFAFLLASPDKRWPHSVCYEGDAPLWAYFALCLQRGQPFEFDLPLHTPGMAYLLAWIWDGRVSAGLLAEKSLLCVLGSISCVLVWQIARSRLGDRIALLAGFLSAVSFGLTVQSTSLNNETPYTLLLLAIVGLTIRAATFRSFPILLALALLNGLAVLLRAEHTLLFVMLCLHLLWRWRRSGQDGHALTVGGGPERRSVRAAPRSHGDARRGGERRRTSNRTAGDTGATPARRASWMSGNCRAAVGVAILAVGFVLVPLPWNVRSYRAIQRANTVEPRPVDYAGTRIPWAPAALEFIRSLPAFTREGCLRELTDLAARAGLTEVTEAFARNRCLDEIGYIPEPLSPFFFVTNQGPLSFALANNALADGGFSTKLLDPTSAKPVRLAFGNPRHLRLCNEGYAIGLRYLREHPHEALGLLGRKLAIFSRGLTQGLTPWNLPLGVEGVRLPVDQMTPAPGHGRVWSALVLLLGGTGLFTCARRNVGAIWFIVLAQKILVTLAFYGYARQAASILPVFYVLVALGLDVLLIRPLIRIRPVLTNWLPPVIGAIMICAFAAAVVSGMRTVRYDVTGPVSAIPALGPGAFESHQRLTIRQRPYHPADDLLPGS